LVKACPTCLSQLFLQLRGDLCFRFTLALGPQPLKPGDYRENADCGHHRVTNALMGPFASFLLRDARLDVISLFSAKRRSKVFD
jgi:hypothetical protein